tara:strand:+ start:473 stop:1279 length:807 start_codon:yes stop_codon:yes gene_type:complete
MLDESRREELTAKLQELADSNKEPSEPVVEAVAEPQQSEPEEREDDNTEAEASPADDSEQDEEPEPRHQSGAQKRISELVQQRNRSNGELRELQDQFAQMQAQLQQSQAQAQNYSNQQQTIEADEYGHEEQQANPQLMQLQNEFNEFRNTQVQEQVRNQLEMEIDEAVTAYPTLESGWLRRQLIDAVRLDGSANLMEIAEYNAEWVKEIGSAAVQSSNPVQSERTPGTAPPRPASRSSASADLSQSGNKPLTREQARERAVQRLQALG